MREGGVQSFRRSAPFLSSGLQLSVPVPSPCAVQLRVQSARMGEKIAQQLTPYINENTQLKMELEANRREVEKLRAALALAEEDAAPAGGVVGENNAQPDRNSAQAPIVEEGSDGQRMRSASILKHDAGKDGASTTSDCKLTRRVSCNLPKFDSPGAEGTAREQCEGPLRSTSGQAGGHQRTTKNREHSLRAMLRRASVTKLLRSSLS
jgi:regulator of replication initiation timing